MSRLFDLQGRGVKLGLENIRALLAYLGAPHRRYRVVQVAGTNGKGSTSAYLAAGLRAAGRRVGLFTSPHLVDFRERVRVDGEPIAPSAVVAEWAEIAGEIERCRMTFFEANTAIAVSHFARSGCQEAVLETGLGGRLDATTAAEAKVCVLTRIAFDHRETLGETLSAIAGEKAAILRPGTRALSAPQEPEAADAILAAARRNGARLRFVVVPAEIQVGRDGTTFDWRGERVRLRMVGRHQAENAVLALETLAELVPRARPAELVAGVERVEVPGRFQRVTGRRGPLLLDVAHNPDALHAFARALADAYPGAEARLFLAMLRDKDLGGSLAVLQRSSILAGEVLVGSAASAPESRRLRRDDWLSLPAPARSRARWVGGVPQALAELESWQAAHADRPQRIAAVVGSFTTVGEAMTELGVDPLAA